MSYVKDVLFNMCTSTYIHVGCCDLCCTDIYMYVHVISPWQGIGWFSLGLSLVVEDELAKLSCTCNMQCMQCSSRLIMYMYMYM